MYYGLQPEIKLSDLILSYVYVADMMSSCNLVRWTGSSHKVNLFNSYY